MTTQHTSNETSPAGSRNGNAKAFEARMGHLNKAFPGLRLERTRSGMEWFLRSSRSLSAKGLPLDAALVVDMPCDEDTSEILDAMAYANDPTLDRPALDAALSGEAAYLNRMIATAVDLARTLARRDLAAPGIRKDAYLSTLGRELGKAVELFPAGCEDGAKEYYPGKDLRERVRSACAAALKEASRSTAAPRSGKPRNRRPEPSRGRAPVRAGRPFRMRRYSPLYE